MTGAASGAVSGAVSGASCAILPREYPFSDRDFERIRELVHQRIGISLTDAKRELVYSRISRRLRKLQLGDFNEYLARVSGDRRELQQLLNAITTNLTAFFREQHHFSFLADELLPQLLVRNAGSRRIRIWSAGCSTGEEAYSIAMVIREALGRNGGWNVRILATDVDSEVLERARRGVYGASQLKKVDSVRVRRWFEYRRDSGEYAVRSELRSLIRFNSLNLIDSWPLRGPFDLIFCRNVIIYFDRDTQTDVVARMAALQRHEDHLILGHSESLLSVSTQYQLVGQTTYRKLR